MLNGLDLFSGIGGLTLALSNWVKPVTYCENDRYAQAVLLSRQQCGELPQAPIWDDVTTLRGSMLPMVDIIYGGFPCQDISIAGTGKGLEGERSGLVEEIFRLLGEIRPRFVFMENVPAIVFRGHGHVVSKLASLGYDCRWTIISAAEVGAYHLRERWWLLGHTESESVNLQLHTNTNGKKLRTQPERFGWSQEAIQFARSSNEGRIAWTPKRHFEPRVDRDANGIQNRTHRYRGLGNAVVPEQARAAFVKLMGLKQPQSNDNGG